MINECYIDKDIFPMAERAETSMTIINFINQKRFIIPIE